MKLQTLMIFIGLTLHQSLTATADERTRWQSLFDGETLNGWKQLNGTANYEVADGSIVGTTVEGSWNSFLCTERQYGDFELEVEVRVHDRLNSGVQIRSKTRDKTVDKGPNLAAGRVIGPQVEIEASMIDGAEAGYIYGEATGKACLTPEERLKPHKHFKDGEWNHFRVVARGARIQTWINGVAIEDLTDEETFAEYPRGFIGLQVHRIKPGSGPYSVAWRNIRLKELSQTELTFRHHFVDRDLPGGSWGQTALVDVDLDGDLDFITGQKAGDIRWYEFDSENRTWSLHLLGRDSPSDVGGLAMDVDRDGRVDFVAGGAWYRQPQHATAQPWTRYVFDQQLSAVHDIIAADLDGDGHDEVITMSDKNDVRFYRIPTDDPTGRWKPQRISDPVHAGLAAGDIDGDGDIDLVRSQIWLENVGGGKSWKKHAFCGIPWANRKEQYFYYLASRSWIVDINRDGRQDIVLTENEIPGGRIAWFEAPEDPKQPNWTPHFLKASDGEARGPYHSLQLADFDNDGDTDIFAGEMESLAVPPHRWFIWENVNGDGSNFVERVILDKQLGTHETQAGDVDGDGDIDLVGKLWRPVPDNGNRGQNHVDFLENLTTEPEISATHTVNERTQSALWPSPNWPSAEPAELGLEAGLLQRAEQYALSAGGSGMIIHRGHVVRRWGDQRQRYDIKSATKSFGATMLGVALKDCKMELHAPARRYHPTLGVPPEGNETTRWLDEVSLFHLVTQTAGFEKRGGYEKLLFKPGTQWHYSDGGPNWLAECITLQYGRDLEDLMFERVFTPLGITRNDLRWRKNQYREHEIDGINRREFGAGIHCNVEALSRLGYLYLHNGRWKDQQILTEEFVRMARQPLDALVGLPEWDPEAHKNASDHYSLLWWNNGDSTLADVPRDAYWAWGLYDSLIVVIPSLDTVVVRAGARGKSLRRKEGESHYAVLKPLLGPIVAAVNQQADRHAAKAESQRVNPPYPMSDVITKVLWSPKGEIIRLAKGSDNWPMTWADDGRLYSAYGDGWGFKPMVEKKLSLGLVRVEGTPPDIKGINVRSSDAERIGQGKNGEKASGMLMVDGMLYMFVRNASNSQLGWSDDHGKTWTWSEWKFTTSFGCPTFLNFGQNYANARDEFVYLYSHDSNSAYDPADRMVMARVGKSNLTSRDAYEFFERLDDDDQPVWTKDVAQRGAVFVHPGECYRSGVTYNSGLERYLWCQILPESNHPQGQRFQGGFGVYEAAEPWGPWRTVYFTRDWDVGPGETSSFPTKWISDDGQTVHLVFSGDDYFSVRKATLSIAPSKDRSSVEQP